MIRFVLRVLATVALAIAVVMAVVDATRSIAASTWRPTSLAESWDMIAPGGLEAAHQATVQMAGAAVWDHAALPLLALPAFAVFAFLALVLYVFGHRREQRRDRRFADA